MAASACLARAAARPGARVRGSPVDTSLTSCVLSDQRAAAGVGGPDRARARAAAGGGRPQRGSVCLHAGTLKTFHL